MLLNYLQVSIIFDIETRKKQALVITLLAHIIVITPYCMSLLKSLKSYKIWVAYIIGGKKKLKTCKPHNIW